MLKGDLYKVQHYVNRDGIVEADLVINPYHEIFTGHFPGQPVLPGVCMIQIVKELVEDAVAKKLMMHIADSCKFLNMLDPTQSREIHATISYTNHHNKIQVNAVLKNNEIVLLKMQSGFKIL